MNYSLKYIFVNSTSLKEMFLTTEGVAIVFKDSPQKAYIYEGSSNLHFYDILESDEKNHSPGKKIQSLKKRYPAKMIDSDSMVYNVKEEHYVFSKSSKLQEMFYDHVTQKLTMIFKPNNKVAYTYEFSYHEFEELKIRDLSEIKSPGSYFIKLIEGAVFEKKDVNIFMNSIHKEKTPHVVIDISLFG